VERVVSGRVDPLLDDALGGGLPASPDDLMRALLVLADACGTSYLHLAPPEVPAALALAARIRELRPDLVTR
jgi:hypothetical protein